VDLGDAPAIESQSRQSPFAVVKAVAETTAVIGALAYVAGWSSLYSYYNAFGIGLFGLDIPFAVGCVFAIRVLIHSIWPALILAIMAVIYAVIKSVLRRRLHSGVLAAVVLLALAITFALSGAAVGLRAAATDMLEETSQLPLVAFVTTAKPTYAAPDCLSSNTLDCRLLVHSGGQYYFFEPIKEHGGQGEFQSLTVEVFTIPDKELALARVQREAK
jgi:hypothetical protein